MVAREAQLRRRGFFLHSSDGEADAGEHENPEGVVVRVRFSRASESRQLARSSARFAGGRQARGEREANEGVPSIRSGSVTGSRQRSHLPR
jgi:hypothetical protein